MAATAPIAIVAKPAIRQTKQVPPVAIFARKDTIPTMVFAGPIVTPDIIGMAATVKYARPVLTPLKAV